MAGHAKLSPSTSHRWMNCSGSIKLIGDESSTTNQAAMLGTAAHKVIEMMIIQDIHDAREFAGYTMVVKADGDEETEAYAPDQPAFSGEARPGWFAFIVDEKMVDGVQQTIDEVDRLKDEMCEGTELFSEVYLDGSWLDSRLGGTIDVRLVEPFGWIKIVDHKNGFIIVEATDNDQLKQYAVLAAHEHPDCEGVTVVISQPNAPHIEGTIRSESFTIDELKLYEIRMKEAAEATSAPNAPLRAGDWCLWCPAKTRCKEFDAMLLEEAQADFAEEPPALIALPKSTEELARKARWVPVIDAWARQIEGDIQTELLNGNAVEGFKLVHGKSNRRLINEIEAQRVLVEEVGVPDEQLWVEPKMKGPAQLEKLGVGKEQRKLVKKKVAELSFKPPGRVTVAADTDPREAVSAADEAANEFAEDLTGDEDDFV